MRKNIGRQNRFKQIAAMALGFASLGLAAPTHAGNTAEGISQHAQTTNATGRKDALAQRQTPVRPTAKRNAFGGFSGDANPYKMGKKGIMNQRQLRKFLRQNPTQRKKYNK